MKLCNKLVAGIVICLASREMLHSLEQTHKLTPAEQQDLNYALLDAVEANDEEGIKKLLTAGANINARVVGDTPLTWVITNNRTKMLRTLVEYGADINVKDRRGNTPLIVALKKVLERADELRLGVKNNERLEALRNQIQDNIQIAMFLIDRGADRSIPLLDIERVNKEGETLLMNAVNNQDIALVQLLIALGANPYIRDNLGLDSFDYADTNQSILALLKQTKHKQVEHRPKKPKFSEDTKRRDAIYSSLLGRVALNPPQSSIKPDVYERATGLTTSEVYAEIFRYEIGLRYSAEIEQNKINILKLLARERRYFDDYFVFYHGQNAAHRIVQDFWLEILALVQLRYPEDFIPMRFWGGKKILSNSNPKAFLTSTELIPKCKSGIISDLNPQIGQHILSVNISLFGNIRYPADSSLEFYLQNASNSDMETANLLKEVTTFFDFNQDFVDKITSSQSLRMADFGSLVQIFIPKKLVDNCVYLAITFGCAYTDNLGVGGYEFIDNYGYQAKISPILEAIQSGTLPKGKLTKGVLEQLQARIIIGKDIMLDPTKGVKIFREVNLPKAKLEAYHHEIRRIALEVIIDWLQMITSRDPAKNKELIARLQGTPLADIIKDKDKALDLLFYLQGFQREHFPKPQLPKPVVPSKL
jgi:hypothetical protein